MTKLTNSDRARIAGLVLLPLLGIALIVATIFLVRPKETAHVVEVSTDGAGINTGDVLDATDPKAKITPRVGYRYKVFLEDESDDRSSGIGRIGGMTTFVPNTKRGQTVLVDVTRVRNRVVDAVLVRVLDEKILPPKQKESYIPKPGDSAAEVVPGAEFDIQITDPSSKNPETEGVGRIKGLIVFVEGATQIGERVHIRIIERRERMAFAELTGKPAGDAPISTSRDTDKRGSSFSYVPPAGDATAHVVPGAVLRLKITELSSKNPDEEGVAREKGLVIFVKGGTTVGDTVNVRITERRERSASGEVTTDALTRIETKPPDQKRENKSAAKRAPASSQNTPPTEGSVIELTIAEASTQHPGQEGIAFLEGRRIVVEGAVEPGQTVMARITRNLRTVSFAELVP